MRTASSYEKEIEELEAWALALQEELQEALLLLREVQEQQSILAQKITQRIERADALLAQIDDEGSEPIRVIDAFNIHEVSHTERGYEIGGEIVASHEEKEK